MTRKPFRLALAQKVCRPLPPLISQRVRTVIYPQEMAFKDDYEFEVRALTGSRFRSRTSDFHGYPFSVHGYYEWRNWAIALAVCSSGDHIIEIGANIGTETVGFADIVGKEGRVYAFEPFPNNVKALQEIVTLNGCDQVIVLTQAVGAIGGKVKFVCPPDKHASGIGFVSRADSAGDGPVIEVECVTLDSLQQTLGPCRAIFMDVEGAEIDILRGGTSYIQEFQPIIVLEASPKTLQRAGFNLYNLHEQIAALGYQAFRIGRLGVRKVDLASSSTSNWLCVPLSKQHILASVKQMIRRSGFFPCIPGLNPMTAGG